MPINAVLGANGATGSAVLRYLLEEPGPDLTINILVRSREKLLNTFPELETQANVRINIFVSSITDVDCVAKCLDGADVVFVCVSAGKPAKVITTAQTAAASTIAALRQLQMKDRGRAPVFLINRSMMLNPNLNIGFFTYLEPLLLFAVKSIYDDLKRTIMLYQAAHDEALLKLILVDGPSLHDSEGTVKTGHRLLLSGQASMSINYADFGAGFVEIARRREEFEGQAVGISATGIVRESFLESLAGPLLGLRIRILGF